MCEARQKINNQLFLYLLKEINLEKSKKEKLWKGHRVRAIDGTKMLFPNSNEILSKYPKRKTSTGKEEFYPLGQLVTAVNVFSSQTVSAKVGNKHMSERDTLLNIANNEFSKGDISLLDRGFQGRNVWDQLIKKEQLFVNRVTKVYQKHLGSKKENIFTIKSGKEFLELRIIRGHKRKDGSYLLLITNLLNKKKYKKKEILKLYKKRWEVETVYKYAKNRLKMGNFHSTKVNGIKQEIFATLFLISLIARQMRKVKTRRNEEVNFNAALEVVRKYLLIIMIIGINPEQEERIKREVGRIKIKKREGRSYARISKQSENKWIKARRANSHVPRKS